ncbi:MAG: Sec-independent protein translocase protein TatB [Actinomycetota bacterium]
MFNVGGPEVLIILVVALVVLGPSKLPEAARQFGRAMSEFRRMSSGFQAELRDALNEPVDTTQAGPSSPTSPAQPVDPPTTADDEPTA